MNGLVWIHEFLANSGAIEKLLAGDTSLCSIAGVLIGCCIGWEQLKRQMNQDNG